MNVQGLWKRHAPSPSPCLVVCFLATYQSGDCFERQPLKPRLPLLIKFYSAVICGCPSRNHKREQTAHTPSPSVSLAPQASPWERRGIPLGKSSVDPLPVDSRGLLLKQKSWVIMGLHRPPEATSWFLLREPPCLTAPQPSGRRTNSLSKGHPVPPLRAPTSGRSPKSTERGQRSPRASAFPPPPSLPRGSS